MATGDPAGGSGYSIERATVRAGATRILDRIDLQIGRGALTVLAGPSGSGKSTLLRLCNRLEVPTEGRVLLDGADLAGMDPLALRRRAGMVFQRPVTFAGTSLDNLRVADPAIDDDTARRSLEGVGLDPSFLGRQADDLSGGEAQRLCLARSLITRPEILLMDEPTSALDVDARSTIERLTRTLADDGLTVVWVTHDLEQAERLADRLVVIVAGRVVGDDAAAEAVARRSFTAIAPDPGSGADPDAAGGSR